MPSTHKYQMQNQPSRVKPTMQLLGMSLCHCKTNKQPPTMYEEQIMLRDSFGTSCLLHPTGGPSTLLQAWSWSWRNLASTKPSAKSKSCSHGHTIAVINQNDGNYKDLEQTIPKAICKQELSAERFIERIKPKPFHPQSADNAQSTERICK